MSRSEPSSHGETGQEAGLKRTRLERRIVTLKQVTDHESQ